MCFGVLRTFAWTSSVGFHAYVGVFGGGGHARSVARTVATPAALGAVRPVRRDANVLCVSKIINLSPCTSGGAENLPNEAVYPS